MRLFFYGLYGFLAASGAEQPFEVTVSLTLPS
jgi:hypothetical protein